MDFSLPAPLSTEFSSKNTRVGSHSLLQRIFLTQELNPYLLHCRWIARQDWAWLSRLVTHPRMESLSPPPTAGPTRGSLRQQAGLLTGPSGCVERRATSGRAEVVSRSVVYTLVQSAWTQMCEWPCVDQFSLSLSLSHTHIHTHTPYRKVIQHCPVLNSLGPRFNLTFVESLPHDFRHISLLFCAPVFSSVTQILTGLFCWQDDVIHAKTLARCLDRWTLKFYGGS